jgi:hypothetical protein
MCIAIYKPAGKIIDKETLFTCWCGNSHGAGIAYVKDGALHIIKGLMTFGEFYKAYKEYSINKYQALIHFRMATHGARDRLNTHPFEVTPELALIHNGIISTIRCTDQRMSDTYHFAKFMKQVVNNNRLAWRNPEIKREIELEILHSYNKVAFLHANGTFEIYNRGGWIEENGVLYSNGGFRFRNYYSSSTTRSYGNEFYGYGKENESDVDFLQRLYRERQGFKGRGLGLDLIGEVREGSRIPRRKKERREDREPIIHEVNMEDLFADPDGDEGSTLGENNSVLNRAADTLLAQSLREEAIAADKEQGADCEHCFKPQDGTELKKYGNYSICISCEKILKESGVNVSAM